MDELIKMKYELDKTEIYKDLETKILAIERDCADLGVLGGALIARISEESEISLKKIIDILLGLYREIQNSKNVLIGKEEQVIKEVNNIIEQEYKIILGLTGKIIKKYEKEKGIDLSLSEIKGIATKKVEMIVKEAKLKRNTKIKSMFTNINWVEVVIAIVSAVIIQWILNKYVNK